MKTKRSWFLRSKNRTWREYHYRLYRRLAELVADNWSSEASSSFKALVRDELTGSVHGEVDDDSWQVKQTLLRRQSNIKRETQVFEDYVRQSFIDTLTLYLHGICCDIDVETGPRQLPSRYLRKTFESVEVAVSAAGWLCGVSGGPG